MCVFNTPSYGVRVCQCAILKLLNKESWQWQQCYYEFIRNLDFCLGILCTRGLCLLDRGWKACKVNYEFIAIISLFLLLSKLLIKKKLIALFHCTHSNGICFTNHCSTAPTPIAFVLLTSHWSTVPISLGIHFTNSLPIDFLYPFQQHSNYRILISH
jgi:hypothetical protein